MLHNDLSGSPVLIKDALGVLHFSAHLTGHPFCFMPSVAEPTDLFSLASITPEETKLKVCKSEQKSIHLLVVTYNCGVLSSSYHYISLEYECHWMKSQTKQK